jgi:electron transfer flavoprotein beta subunit
MSYHIVVCGGIAPDPLQTLEPVSAPAGPALKNEMMLPAVLDPWASHALYEAAHLAKQFPGGKVTLVSMSPKAKLQQVMMTIAQKVAFDLVAIDGPSNGFIDSAAVAEVLSGAIDAIPGLDRSRLLVCGGWESATRGSGTTMQMVGERLGITDQFQGVDELRPQSDGSFEVVERLEGGKRQISRCEGPPILLGWATGNLPEPPNQPQLGMQNMRTIMPALQKAKPAPVTNGIAYHAVGVPSQQRDTRIVKDMPAAQIARELLEWMEA